MPRPTQAQINAAQAVLYQPKGLRRLRADANSIGVLMNLDNPSQTEGGPLWTIAATGKPSGAVTEAVARCRRIASTLRAIQAQLGRVSLPTRHKNDLRTGLRELAATWDARADAWAEPGAPDVEAHMKRISGHQAASARALKRVSAYLRTAESIGVTG